jgi:HEPN domain-containing protein
MRNDEVAQWGMRRARGWLEGAESALRAGDLPRAVYESQMAVELAAKSGVLCPRHRVPKGA